MPCISGKWSKAKLLAKLNIRNYWIFFMGRVGRGGQLGPLFFYVEKGETWQSLIGLHKHGV